MASKAIGGQSGRKKVAMHDGFPDFLLAYCRNVTRLWCVFFALNAAAGNKTLVIAGGFAQMQGDVLTLLADSAVDAATIDPKQASDELQKVTANAVSGGGTSPEQRDAIELAQQIAYAKVAATRSR